MVKKPKQYKPKRGPGDNKKFKRPGLLSAREKGYDSVWDRYRRRFLYHNPNCYCCGSAAKIVDHLQAWKGDTELFESLVNHIPMCVVCHNTVTGKFDRHEVPDLEGKMKWIAETRAHFNVVVKVKVLRSYDDKKKRYN